jgi:hypothetical protein
MRGTNVAIVMPFPGFIPPFISPFADGGPIAEMVFQ